MTIATTTSRVAYVGDGVTTAFAVPFAWQANADLKVYLQSSAGVQTLQLLGTDYTLAGVGVSSGGTCTFTTAPTSTTGATITIYRDPPVTQTTSYNNNDPFPAKSHENALDKVTMLEQRTRDMISRTVQLPDGDPILDMHLPPVATRGSRVLGFDASGLPVATTGPSYVGGTEVGVAFVSTRSIATVTVFASSVLYIQTGGYTTAGDGGGARYKKGSGGGSFTDGGGTSWVPVFADDIYNVKAFGAKGDAATDDTTAVQAAITAAAGRPIYLPAGTYVITSQLTYITTGGGIGTFNPGLQMFGAGPLKTRIDNRVASNSCIYVAQNDGLGFQLNGGIRDLSIFTTTSPVSSHGIEYKACYQYKVENVWVKGLTGDGMRVTCAIGDADASNEMMYLNCRFENCNIGLNCNFSAGVVQPSFMRVDNCFFSANAIGWRYIGLQGTMINSAFVIHTTVALQFVNNGGSNAQFTSLSTSFENNLKAIEINSLQGGDFIQTEFASGSGPVSTTAVDLISVVGARFEGSRIRISSTPHTLWAFGANATGNQISNSFYHTYDAAGQTRYSVNASAFGNRLDDSFDAIQAGTQAGILSLTMATGANNNIAVPFDGAFYGINGPGGAFSLNGLTNGFDGRKLELHNNSGQTLTVNLDNAGSTAANRIRGDAGVASYTVNNLGTIQLRYVLGVARWLVTGRG